MKRTTILTGLALLLLMPIASANEWTSWRGPEGNGVSREKNLPTKLDQVLWKKGPETGISCRSTPIVMNDRVYIINNVGEGVHEQERIMCMDAKTGKVLWEHRFGIYYTPIVSVRLGWTVLAGDPETGNVYGHGTQGNFYCFDKDGKILWEKSLTEEYGRISGYGGRVTSPVVEGDMVIMGMLNASWGNNWSGQTRFVAMDKRTGKVRWWSGTGIRPKNSYNCVPVVATLNGERVLLSGGGDGCIHAFQVNTGKKLWSYEYGSGAMNPSPVVDGHLIYAAHGEENPVSPRLGKLVCLDASQMVEGQPKKVWEVVGVKFKYCSPLLINGMVIIPDERGFLFAYNAKDGKQIWRKKFGRAVKGSPAYGDGKIYISSVYGYFHILEPGEKSCKTLDRKKYRAANPMFDVEVNSTAAIANGCVYFGTSEEFYCLGKYNEEKVAVPEQKMPEKADPKAKATQALVYPADAYVKAGESVSFKVNLYDEKGRFLREADKVEWKLAPMAPQPRAPQPPMLKGAITADGKYTSPNGAQGQFGRVVATVNGLEAAARIRQVVSLPYKEDFESVTPGLTPGSWVDCQLKWVVREVDGNKVLVKTAAIPSPIVARGRTYCGTPEMTDYTIQADVLGKKVRDNLPDMGIMNNRYTLQLDGNTQQLRVNAWDAIPRIDEGGDFAWKEDTWYTLKLKVEVKKDHAMIYGKAWPKGKPEPKEWHVTVKDPNPERNGAPGLYAYAVAIDPPKVGTESYFDNVIVTPNTAGK